MFKKYVSKFSLILSGLGVVFALVPFDEASAVPAFARAQNVSCNMCHSGFPKLNHVGAAFEHNGFRMKGEQGKYLWEQPLALAGRVSTGYSSKNIDWTPAMGTMKDKKSSAFGLNDWQLFTAGTLAPGVSYFGQIVGHVEGLAADAGNATTPADTMISEIETETFWVQVNDVLADSALNVRIGKDHVDNHFLSTPLRLTRAGYLIQTQPMLGASLHPSSVGAQINGMVPFAEYNIGIRNYGPSYDSADDNEQRFGAYYVILNRHVMGENTVSFLFNSDRKGDVNSGTDDEVFAYGLSLDLHLQDLNIVTGLFNYTEGKKVRSGNKMNALSGTMELIYPLQDRLIATARYDFNQWDVDNDSLQRDAKQAVLSLSWYQHPNFRWLLEYSQLNTENMMYMPMGHGSMLNTTMGMAEQQIDTFSLLVEANF